MATEIERKFLVNHPPIETWGQGIIIRQGYLARGTQATARVRIADDRGWLTVKGQTVGISRLEFEYEIPLADAEGLLTLCEGHLIEKTRWCIPHHKHLWEVDVFAGVNAGLTIAEIELRDEQEEFTRPPWVTEEVSDDPRYFNGYLSRTPYPTWSSHSER